MNMTPSSFPSDDLLARAEAALREAPVPAGPAAETISRTLSALRAVPRRRVFSKVAAALLFAAAGATIAGLLMRFEATPAFAEVAQQLRDAKTLTYQLTVQAPVMKSPMTMRVLLKAPDWVRMESPDGPITIGRLKEAKSLVLEPKSKTAMFVELKKSQLPQGAAQADSLQRTERLRKLVEKEGQPAGKQRIGDIEAQGYRVVEGQQEWLIWADLRTKQPLRVEVKWPPEVRATLSDLRLDVPLADDLFRLEPPSGYKRQEMIVQMLSPEDAIVWVLRLYTDTPGGRFPPKLNDPAAFGKHLRELHGNRKIDKPSPADMQEVMNTTRVVLFVNSLKGDHGYRPGVMRGDASRIVFWYRPAGAAQYRALYGDLHWADVTADQLPKPAK
jgi:outer membrane lipoprotein-sorting protein